jgi:hypothetical protein
MYNFNLRGSANAMGRSSSRRCVMVSARRGRVEQTKQRSGGAAEGGLDASHSQSITIPLSLPDLLRSTPSSRHCKRILRHIHVLSLHVAWRHPVGPRLRLRLWWLLASLL